MDKIELSKQYLEGAEKKIIEMLEGCKTSFALSREFQPSPANAQLLVDTLVVRKLPENEIVLTTSIPIPENVVHFSCDFASRQKKGTCALTTENPLRVPFIVISTYALLLRLELPSLSKHPA